MAITRIFALALLLAFTLSPVSADSSKISLNSPQEINQGEEFQISISLQNNSDLIYDVKAFVGKASKENSEIFYDQKWQSPFNYIKEAFPSESEFTLRANQAGNTKVCVRFRESGKTSFIEACNEITVLPSVQDSETSQDNSADYKESAPVSTKPKINSDSTIKSPPISQSSSFSPAKPQIQIQAQEKIFLNQKPEIPKSIDTPKQAFISTLSYSFIFFLVLLIILFTLNKL